ncbi:hypothetical protein [Campylobacter concisus]|uniref:hypothetical protein n=1 Tax=Campylobacter concisus TaxID=199 RepID=UPI001CB74C42|nr:hypothetical protein [Campylobacter concisus]
MFKVEVIYKFCLVLVLILGLCMLAFSGVNFALGEYNEYLLNTHKIADFFNIACCNTSRYKS